MRSRVLAVLVVALLSGSVLSACGGDSGSADVVPKSTPDLTVPNGADALAGEGGGGSTTSTTDTTDTTSTTGTATTEPGASTDTGAAPAPAQTEQQQQPPASTTGGVTPQTEQPEDTTGGAGTSTDGGGGGGTGGAGDFNQFCQDNPGACPGN